MFYIQTRFGTDGGWFIQYIYMFIFTYYIFIFQWPTRNQQVQQFNTALFLLISDYNILDICRYSRYTIFLLVYSLYKVPTCRDIETHNFISSDPLPACTDGALSCRNFGCPHDRDASGRSPSKWTRGELCVIYIGQSLYIGIGVLVDTTYNGECSMEQGDSTYQHQHKRHLAGVFCTCGWIKYMKVLPSNLAV